MTTIAVTSGDGKENAALMQSTLTPVTVVAKGKKRTLTLADGGKLDLDATLPATPQVVEAMKRRIIELEDQLSVTEQPPAKRARTSATAASDPVASGSGLSSNTKADEKKRKMQVKKIFDRLKKECKAEGVKFQGSPKSIKFDEVLEQTELETLFSGKGTLIQPTPLNKPKSTVTIIQFNGDQIREFLGTELKNLKGNVWSRGGGPSFSKSYKLGTCDVDINSLEVSYSKNGMKCTLKFEVDGDESSQVCSGGGGGRNRQWVFTGF